MNVRVRRRHAATHCDLGVPVASVRVRVRVRPRHNFARSHPIARMGGEDGDDLAQQARGSTLDRLWGQIIKPPSQSLAGTAGRQGFSERRGVQISK